MEALGGNTDLSIDVPIANDTGSNIQTIFDSDLRVLQYNQLSMLGSLDQPLSTLLLAR